MESYNDSAQLAPHDCTAWQERYGGGASPEGDFIVVWLLPATVRVWGVLLFVTGSLPVRYRARYRLVTSFVTDIFREKKIRNFLKKIIFLIFFSFLKIAMRFFCP